MTQQRISDYEIVDHGIDGSQYFPGCGVAFTSFAHVATGIGDNFDEALDDALESIAQNGVDVEIDSSDYHESEQVPEDSEDTYYYVSVRYNIVEGSEVSS